MKLFKKKDTKEKDKDKEKEKDSPKVARKETPTTPVTPSPAVTAAPAAAPSPNRASTADDENEMIFGAQKVCADDFELLVLVGRGSFGKVFQVRKKDDGKILAMKVLVKDTVIARKQVEHTKAEKTILQKISHPFIISLKYSFQTKDKLYMILDFVNGGELFTHLKKEGRFSEERVRFYAAELASALIHLHSFNVAYRDLKPENILLDSEGHIRITDFGLSKEIEQNSGTHTFCGTPEYLAPEVLKGEGHGCAVDWWSLGTLVYEMMASLPPFYSPNTNVMYQKILTAELKFPPHFSPEACSFISGCLQRDPSKRLGSGPDGATNVKNHPWFKGLDWNLLEKKEVTPPFIPEVVDIHDVQQIDPAFTAEEPVDSPVEVATELAAGDDFQGFTYVAESGLEVK